MPTPKQAFEITQYDTGRPVESRILLQPDGVTSLPQGTALAQSNADTAAGDLALLAGTAGGFIGFLSRDISVEGATLADKVFPGRLERPFKFGSAVGIEHAVEVEFEGTAHAVLSGTGALSAGTTAGTKLNFAGGKFRAAQGSETPYFELTHVLPAEITGNTFRVRARRL